MVNTKKCKQALWGSAAMVLNLSSALKRAKKKSNVAFDLLQDAAWSAKTLAKNSSGRIRKIATDISKGAALMKAKGIMEPRKIQTLLKKARTANKLSAKSCGVRPLVD